MSPNQAYEGKKFGGAPPPQEIGAVQGEHRDQVDVWTYIDRRPETFETSPIRLAIDQPGQRRAEAWLSVDIAEDLVKLLQAAIARVKSG